METGSNPSATLAPVWTRAHSTRAVSKRPSSLPSAFSWFLMLRMSALLSLDTSVAVLRPPALSGLKYCEPNPHSSPRAAHASAYTP